MENKQKSIPPLDDMHKMHKSVRYDIRNVRFYKTKCPIYPHGLRNDINVFCHLTELNPLHLRLQSLRTPLHLFSIYNLITLLSILSIIFYKLNKNI